MTTRPSKEFIHEGARGRDGMTPLMNSAEHKDIALMLISGKADVNAPAYITIYKGPDVKLIRISATPLHIAAMVDGKEVAGALLASGANINAGGEGGFTPLHAAALFGSPGVAKLLIAGGADVNARDRNGATPLLYAAYDGHLEVAKLLVAQGADVNAADSQGRTPAAYAAAMGRDGIAGFLRKHGGK